MLHTHTLISARAWLLGAALSQNVVAQLTTSQPAAQITSSVELGAERPGNKAIVPTSAGQMGINPVDLDPPPGSEMKGSIGVDTQYLTLDGTSTKWIGSDPSHIMITTITRTTTGSTSLITATVDVKAHKDSDGGLSILISPDIQVRLQDIAAQIPQCSTSKRRNKRDDADCGAKEFAKRAIADTHVRMALGQPLARGVWNEVGDVGDEGYVGQMGESSGYREPYQGFPGEDEGYESGSEAAEDWFEPGEPLPELGAAEVTGGAEEAEVLGTIVFGTEAEAAALSGSAGAAFAQGAGAASGGAGAGAGAAAGAASGVLALPAFYSYLSRLWKLRSEEYGELGVGAVMHIAASQLQTISRTTTRTTKTLSTQTTTSTSSSSSSACPTATPQCSDSACRAATDIADGKNKCTDGDLKGCICNAKMKRYTNYAKQTIEQLILSAVDEVGTHPAPKAITSCDTSKLSEFPQNLFDGLYGSFCKEANGSQASFLWTVDSGGNKLTSQGTHPFGRSIYARTPPVSADQYKDYQIKLQWSPKNGGKDCYSSCSEAFSFSEGNCGYGTHDRHMTTDGSLDIGCGFLSWHINKVVEAPKQTPLDLGDQRCNAASSGHGDTHAQSQRNWAAWFCKTQDATSFDLSPGKEVHWDTTYGSSMHYKISWINGCVTTQESQSPRSPVPGANCQTLLTENYSKCINGGVGGSRDAGCLRYEFWAT